MSSTTGLIQLNHHKNLAQWQQMVYDCRNSGMTVKAWCAGNGINDKTCYYRRQRKVWEATQQQKKQDAGMPGKLPAIIPCTVPLAAQVIIGQASAIIYSLVETAKENGLDPYRYLTWLMREAPKLDLGAEEQIAGLLPANAPEKCRVIKGV